MKRRLLLLTTLLFLSFNSLAQDFPIQITTVVPPPYPQTWEQSLGLGNNAFIVLNNTDLNQSHEIKLTAKITSDNGISVEVLPEATPSQPIVLSPGETRTVFGAELEALYLNYGEGDLAYSGVDVEQIITNPYLPEGTYSFCIKAFDYNTSVPLSNEFFSGCAPPIYITTINPPIITYPFDEQEVDALTPQQLIFSWTPVSYNSPNIRYAFQMVDYTGLNVNVYDLLNENDFQYYSEENILGNILVYGPDKPSLIPNHDYAVRVKAYLLDGSLNIENGGFSDIVRFKYNTSNNFTFTDNFPIDFNPPNIIIPTGDLFDYNFFDDLVLSDLIGFDILDYGTIASSGNTEPEDPPLISEDLGCDGGCSSTPINNNITAAFQAGATVNIGNFQMEIGQFSGSQNGGYNGNGYVKASSFFPYPVKVNYTNLKLNTSGQIMSGEAEVETRQGSWLDTSWDNIEKKFDETYFGNSPQQALDNINDPDFRLETFNDLTQSASITLPVGYGEGDYQVQITKMVFGPNQALFDAMVLIPIPDDMNGINKMIFTASDICISPSGPSIGSSPAKLSLSQTVRYKTSDDFALEINAAGNANLGEGTFVELDCNGFFKANISGQVLFSPEFMIIEKDNGTLNNTDTLSAAFTAEFQTWDSWIGQLSYTNANNSSNGKLSSTRFQYAGLEGYTFKMDNAKYDHDIAANLPGMTFPTGYTGSTTQNWQGLFIDNMEVLLPKWAKDDSNDERMSIAAQSLLIDASGLSGQFDGTDLANLEDGSLGGWDFSIDDAHLKIVSNTFQQGDLTGQLKMPISEDPFDYTANIQHIQNNTQHNFVISTTEDIEMPSFLSDLTLAPNSSITVNVNGNNDVMVEANLNGDITLPDVIGDIPGCSFEDISFQDMKVRNQGELFEIGSFGTEDVSSTITVASVAVGLAGLAMNKLDGAVDEYELGFDLSVQLGESNAAVSGLGKMFLVAQRLGVTPEDFNLTHDRAGMNAFQVSGDLPGVNVSAMVEFFDTISLGHGFAGQFEANFIDAINVQATAMFGSKEIGNETKKFFLVEGMGTLATGFPIAPPVSVYGFGGGLYYNIKPSDNFQVADLEDTNTAPTISSIADKYTFEEGQLGIKAACVIGLTPPDVFNADVGLTVFIDTDDFSVESINLEGNGYMMTKITDRSKPMMTIDALIDYNFSTGILHGEMAMDLKAPTPADPLITANGTLKIHAGDYWYVKFGEPANPVHGLVDLKVYEATLDAYFMSGQNLPSPIIPAHVTQQFPNYTPTLMGNSISTGTGVAMGVHARLVSEVDLFVAYMNLDVGAGFDFTAMSYSNALCNGNTDFGINQWYANVQGYIYGDLSFTTLDYEWLSVNAGIIVEGALPNPTGFHGHAQFSVETFIADFSVNEDFSIGDICQMMPIVNEQGEEIAVSSPIQGMDIIKNVNPGNTDTNVDLFIQPKVQFHIDPNENMIFNYPDGNGGVVNEEIFFSRSVIWKEKINGYYTNVNYTEEWDEANKTYTYTKVAGDNSTQEIGRPSTDHRFQVKVTPGNVVNNNWQEFTDEENGGVLEEIHNNYYTTGKNITSINQAHIDFCRPYRRQRYVTPGDYNNAVVRFNVSYAPAFEEYENNGYSFDAKIYKQGVAAPVLTLPIDYSTDLMALYDISSLEPESTYKVVFAAEKSISVQVEDNNITTNSSSIDISGIDLTGNSNNNTNIQLLFPNSNSNTTTTNNTPTYTTQNVVIDRVDMFTYFFRTSKYNTLAEKINTYSVVSSTVESKPTNLSSGQLANLPTGNPASGFYTYNAINMELAGGEPFDEFDLFAPPIDLGSSGYHGKVISFSYSGSDVWYGINPSTYPYLSCNLPGIPTNNPNVPFSQNTQSADIQLFGFKSQFTGGLGPSNLAMDLEYVGVSKPLTNAEILGEGSGSTQSTFGNLFNSNINIPSNNNLTLIYRGDLGAKQFMCNSYCYNHSTIYQQMTSGLYNFKIQSRDVDMHWDTPTSFKNFTVNLQMP